MRKRRLKKPPPWATPGQIVDYHSVIGEPPTERRMTITAGPDMVCGTWVVWLEGKTGCVAVEALSRHKPVPGG